jgi:uncharacterized protein YdiU (UPF0061 family)
LIFFKFRSDDEARYCYARQISAVQFDLEKLRESLGVLITADAQLSTDDKSKLIQEMAQSLALLRKQADVDLELEMLKKLALSQLENYNVVSLLLSMMDDSRADFTATFRQLSEVNI